MQSNQELIEHLKNQGDLYDEDVEKAMLRVDRIAFVPSRFRESAYKDITLPIDFNQSISAPHMVAIMTQYLALDEGMKVLEVGLGSGYQAAVLLEMIGPEGELFAVDRIPELVNQTKKRLSAYANLQCFTGDGVLGLKSHAPYDRIVVSCGARRIPKALVEQLNEGGRMIIPVGRGAAQRLTLVEKIAGQVKTTDLNYSCRFVSLIE